MSYYQLFNRAYALAIRFNQCAILNDLPMMTDLELIGVANFLAQLRDS